MKISKYQQYFHYFIVCKRRLVEGRHLLEGGAYFNVDT